MATKEVEGGSLCKLCTHGALERISKCKRTSTSLCWAHTAKSSRGKVWGKNRHEISAATCQVVFALQSSVALCDELAETRSPLLVDGKKLSRSLTLEEFKLVHEHYTSRMAHIRERWLPRLKTVVIKKLNESADAERYALSETHASYLESPLRRVALVVQFMTSETLKRIYVEGTEKFAKFFESRTPNAYGIEEISGESGDVLFNTEVVVAQRELVKELRSVEEEESSERQREVEYVPCFAFTRTPREFAEAAGVIFERSLAIVDNLPSLERLLLSKMMGNGRLFKGFNDDDGWVLERRGRVRKSIMAHEEWLEEYISSFRDLEDVLAIDVEAELEAYGRGEEVPTAEEVKRVVSEKLRRREEVLVRIPGRSVRCGMFKIEFGDIARDLAARLFEVAEGILGIEAERLEERMNSEVLPKFERFKERLECKIPDIETVSEISEFLTHLPVEVGKVQKEIEECVEMYEALETFGTLYPLDENALNERWKMFGRPREIMSLATKLSEKLVVYREKFLKKQMSGQDAFEKVIENLEEEVAAFSAHDELSEVERVSALLEDLQDRLENAVSEAKVFNSRETLFNRDATDYSKLGKICR